MKARLEEIRNIMLARYRTIHAFCRANPDITRSTVYLVMSGKYAGNMQTQITRIESALDGARRQSAPCFALRASEVFSVLQDAKCAHCRKQDKRFCPECKTVTMREAHALEDYVRERKRHEQDSDQ